MEKNTNSTVFLYASPESLLQSKLFNVINFLINCYILRLVCVDEVHLYVIFGKIFHSQFYSLRSSVFKYLIDETATQYSDIGTSLRVPLLFMTDILTMRYMNFFRV